MFVSIIFAIMIPVVARTHSGFDTQIINGRLCGRRRLALTHGEITIILVVALRWLRFGLRNGQTLEHRQPLVLGQLVVGNPPFPIIFSRQGGRGRVSVRSGPRRTQVEQIRAQNDHKGAFFDEGVQFWVPVFADRGKRVRVTQKLEHRHLNPLILIGWVKEGTQ